MKKAVIIARVSTPKQEQQGLSLSDIQLPTLREYAKNNDFDVVKEFTFQETADRKIRSKFKEMMDFVRKDNEVKTIIAYRVDRMTRNFRDQVEIDNAVQEFGMEIHFVNDRLIINKDTIGRDIQDWDLKVFLAKQTINRLKDDARELLQAKLRSQEIYGKAPFGYKNVKVSERETTVEVDPFKSGIVVKIFDLYTSATKSYRQIAEILSEEYNLKLYTSFVEKVICNPFYCGYRLYKGERYEHKYDRIIAPDIWNLAKDIREGRYKNTVKGKLKSKTGLFRGLIKCAVCGCSMTPEAHTKKQKNGNVHHYVHYRCTGSRGKHTTMNINESRIEEQLAEVLKKLVLPQDILQDIVSTLKEANKNKSQFTDGLIKECEEQIARNKKRLETCYDDRADGSITQEEYDTFKNRYRSEIQKYTDKLASVIRCDDDYYITAELILEIATKCYELYIGSEPEEKREILGMIFSNLTLDEERLGYSLEKPFDSIFANAERLDWGG